MQFRSAFLVIGLLAPTSYVLAGQATVTWYDPTCRYFVAQLPEGSEGFGLFEWKEGAEPKVGTVLDGDVLGGPDLELDDTAAGQKLKVMHWGDAKSQDVLVRHSPGWCKSKRKK
jgi:hypothetical protein